VAKHSRELLSRFFPFLPKIRGDAFCLAIGLGPRHRARKHFGASGVIRVRISPFAGCDCPANHETEQGDCDKLNERYRPRRFGHAFIVSPALAGVRLS